MDKEDEYVDDIADDLMTDEVMAAIAGLSGQRYFDRPAPTNPRPPRRNAASRL